ncbi:MAG TPA: metal-dependent hydrolase [Thermoanaerobaculia bacterium]|nr:metal-dependent hydrolase [Thermoanaerobaculia bacterium]
MFIGHHAAGFAAKRFAPNVSLGTLFAATMLLDLLWPLFLIADVEHVRIDPGNTAFTPLDFYDYPITHSLLTVLGWSIAAAIVYRIVRKRAWGDAIVVGMGVLSHWILDFVTHRPDLPLWPGGPHVGLGLWNSVPATIAVEVALFVAGLLLYLRTTRAIDRTGSLALWALVVFVGLIYVANITSPPPPSARAIGYAGLAAWLFVPWGYWIDRHRESALPR